VACEEEIVCGGDGESIAHKGCTVDGEGEGHLAGDTGRIS
jgi:hypothetical protein